MTKYISIFVLIAVLIVGVVYFWGNGKGSLTNFSTADYKNLAYLIEGKEINLSNGYSEIEMTPGSASKLITKYFGNEARGDLNGDGKEDVAFLLTQDGGGSGTFFYVAAAIKTEDGYKGTNAVFLGDRISPQSTEYREGGVLVNYAIRGAGEPMTTQPSIGVSKYFKLINNELSDVVLNFEGESSGLETIDLSNKGLTKAPDNIFSRKDVGELNLSNNKITGALQAEVRNLQKLRILNLSNNQFTGVPAEVGQLKDLEVLDLSNNKITGLPLEIGNLSKLKLLDLTGNDYSTYDLEKIKASLPESTVIKTN